jgi:protein SCO1/2
VNYTPFLRYLEISFLICSMKVKLSPTDWIRLGILAAVFIIGITASYYILKPPPKLPIYNPSELDRRLVSEELQRVGINHKVLPFKLVNQFGDTITEAKVEGKIYMADFFFTVCPDICKDMAVQKRRVQEELMNEDFIILSHSVTPVMDSVPVMKAYGELQGAVKGKWHLLTGDKKHIYDLARKSYFAIFDGGGKGDEADFIHTENFILVDPDKRIRGYYDGTSAEDVDRLIKDYAILKKEYPY